MLLSVGVACELSWLLYQRFDEMPTRITIENQFEPIQALPYPAITICSPNQITITAADNLKKSLVNGNLTLDFYKVIPQILGYTELLDINTKDLEQFQDIIVQNRYTAVTVRSLLAQSCKQFLKRCYFQRKLYPCEQLFDPILTKLGMCCVFNSIYRFSESKRNERKRNFIKHKVTLTGAHNALTVIADYNPDDALGGTILNAGAIRVLFTDWTEFPVGLDSTILHSNAEFFHIITGTYTYCSDEVQQLPISSRRCYFTDEFVLPYFKDYHYTDCTLSCLIGEVAKQCHCTMMYVPHAHPLRICNITSIPCIMDVKVKLNRALHVEQCKCLRNCVSRRYSVELITGNLNGVKHMASDAYSGIKFNGSSTLMHFYFPGAVYTKQKQETVLSLINVVSNLGGVFGLCLGCSLISVMEIYFYIYVAVRNYIRKRLKTRRHCRIEYLN